MADYQRATSAYQRGDYVDFMRQLRPSLEGLCRIVIMDLKGSTIYEDIMDGYYPIEKVSTKGQPIVNSMLARVLPPLIQEDHGNIPKKERERIFNASMRLVDAFNICSEVGSHVGKSQLDVSMRAQDNVYLLPTFVETLCTCSVKILSDSTMVFLKETIVPILENPLTIEDVEKIKKEFEDREQAYEKELIEKEKIINSQQEDLNSKDSQLLEAKRETFEARREAYELVEKANAEIREKDAKIAAFEANRLKEGNNPLPISAEKADAQQERIGQLEEENKQAGSEEQSDTVSGGHGIFVEYDSLDDDQFDLIEQNLSESMLVAGCAGSGKSVIAMNKARQIIEEGSSVILIAYTKSLHGFMNEGWNDDVLRGHCMYYYQWKEEQHMPSADYIVVDEIQDFTKIEIEEFMRAAKKCFFFFGDTAQSIYSFTNRPTLSIEQISKLTGLEVMMLYNNYRLPRTVAKITQDYVGIDVRPYSDRVYQSRETSLPHIVGFDSDEAQFDAIVSLLKSHDLGSIGVLIPDNNGVADLYEKILEARISSECKYSLGINRFYDSLDFSTSKPKIMTYHSAKGLQFDTVILPFCKSVSGVEEQKALYVAMTRTKKNLFMLYTGSSRPKPLDKVPELLFQNRC